MKNDIGYVIISLVDASIRVLLCSMNMMTIHRLFVRVSGFCIVIISWIYRVCTKRFEWCGCLLLSVVFYVCVTIINKYTKFNLTTRKERNIVRAQKEELYLYKNWRIEELKSIVCNRGNSILIFNNSFIIFSIIRKINYFQT